jgi:RNA polymerase sigma-70 factor (ECF subfamily)
MPSPPTHASTAKVAAAAQGCAEARGAADGRTDADTRRRARDAELAALLARAATGSVEAFEAFYDATLGYAQSLARRIVADADVDDTLADAYFQVWQQAARFDAVRGGAVTWLLTIVRSRALDRWREQCRRPDGSTPARDEDEADTPGEGPGPDELLEFAERHSRLHAALATLSAQERWLLALAYFRDLTHVQICKMTGLPLGTVKSVILRAQQRLRRQLQSTNCE